MGAGAGQRGGIPQSTPRSVPQAMPRSMPQMGQMPPGVPTQGGISALAAQGSQMDPRLAALMQAMQQRSTMSPSMQPMQPSAPMMPPGGMPMQQDQQGMFDQIRQANPNFGQPRMPVPQVPGMAAPGGARFTNELQTPVVPGDVLVQPPLPVGAGGKGAGMPRPGVPSTMVNPPRPGMMNPRGQAAQPFDPRLAMMMRGRMR